MRTRRGLIASITLGLLGWSALAAAPAQAQDFPTRPVRLISDSGPGSALDAILRVVAQGLSQTWGQQAVVVNQPGGGGSLAVRMAAAAAPDGYTFGIMALSTFVARPGTAD